MRTLLAILLLSACAWAAPTFLVSAKCGSAGGTANCTTSGVDTTGATLLVACITMFGVDPSAPTDSKSNSWTALTVHSNAGTRNKCYYSSPSSVGTSHTFSTNNTSTFPSIVVFAFSGVLASNPLDQQNGGNANSTTVQSGSITPTLNGELVISDFGYGQTGSPTIDSSFSTPVTQAYSAGNNMGTAMAYIVQTTAAAVNPTWTNGTSSSVGSTIASFKPPTVVSLVQRRSATAVW